MKFQVSKTLHLCCVTKENRAAWVEALQAAKELLPRVLSSNDFAASENIGVSTEKLRLRLLQENIDATVIDDYEAIMLAEVSELQNQTKTLRRKQVILLDTLRQLETSLKLLLWTKPRNKILAVVEGIEDLVFYFDSINIFFHNVLHPPEDEVGVSYYGSTHDYFDQGGWDKLHEIGYPELDCLSPCPEEQGTSSSADVNEQPHPKRPMSRTDVPAEAPLKVKHLEGQGEGDEKKSSPSSSSMISFELSNGGHPYGPHVTATLDDDVYVEYPLDNSVDFPSNVDEEEKMFMEAVLMSLKDLETRPPNTEARAPTNETSLPSSVQEDAEVPSKTEVTFTPLNNGHNFESAQPLSKTSSASMGPTLGTPATTLLDTSASTGTSTHSDMSVTVSSSESDTADNTKATLTVVKNPSSNIMDGLIQLWDLNFFRNNR